MSGTRWLVGVRLGRVVDLYFLAGNLIKEEVVLKSVVIFCCLFRYFLKFYHCWGISPLFMLSPNPKKDLFSVIFLI